MPGAALQTPLLLIDSLTDSLLSHPLDKISLWRRHAKQV